MKLDPKDKAELISVVKKVVRRGSFCLSTGTKEFYVSIDKIWADPTTFNQVADILKKILEEEEFDRLVAIENFFDEFGAIPIASVIAKDLRKPLVIWKQRGCVDYSIYGDLNAYDEVIILYDVTAAGRCIKKAAMDIENEGGVIKRIITIVERGEGALQYMEPYKLDFVLSLPTDIVPLLKLNEGE